MLATFDRFLTDASPAPLWGHSATRDWYTDYKLEEKDKGCTDLALQFLENGTHIDVRKLEYV